MKNGKAALWIVLSLLFAGRALAAPDESAVEKGRQVYQKWCLPCHGDGVGKPGTDALAEHYKGQKPAVLEQRSDLTPEMIRQFVRHGVLFMPSFRKTEITDADLAAISSYLTRNNKPKP
ncbi:MAG: cytochrome c [Acidobacteriia bacterium]|nr:cytochrome c [Terriglobia bacterium]